MGVRKRLLAEGWVGPSLNSSIKFLRLGELSLAKRVRPPLASIRRCGTKVSALLVGVVFALALLQGQLSPAAALSNSDVSFTLITGDDSASLQKLTYDSRL